MRCKNCGWDNPEGATYCEKCRQPLVSGQPTVVNRQPSEGRATVSFNNVQRADEQRPVAQKTMPQGTMKEAASDYHWTTKAYLWLEIIISAIVSIFIFAYMGSDYDSIASDAQSHYGFIDSELLPQYVNVYLLVTLAGAILMLLKKDIGLKLQLLALANMVLFFGICDFMYAVYYSVSSMLLWYNLFAMGIVAMPMFLLYTLTAQEDKGLRVLDSEHVDVYRKILYCIELAIPLLWLIVVTMECYSYNPQILVVYYLLSLVMIAGTILLFVGQVKTGRIMYYVAAGFQLIILVAPELQYYLR